MSSALLSPSPSPPASQSSPVSSISSPPDPSFSRLPDISSVTPVPTRGQSSLVPQLNVSAASIPFPSLTPIARAASSIAQSPGGSPSHAHSSLPSALISLIDQFVMEYRSSQHQQSEFNTKMAKLSHLNFVFNYTNASRCLTLERQNESLRSDFLQGKQRLESMETQLKVAESSIENVSIGLSAVERAVEAQSDQLNSLGSSLGDQKHRLESVINEYSKRLEQQEADLKSQQEKVDNLLNIRLKIDFGVDCLILLVAWQIAHFRPLALPVEMGLRTGFSLVGMLQSARNMLQKTDSMALESVSTGSSASTLLSAAAASSSYQRWRLRRRIHLFIQLIQFVAFLYLAKKLKQLAVEKGLHSLVGSIDQYKSIAVRNARLYGLKWWNIVMKRSNVVSSEAKEYSNHGNGNGNGDPPQGLIGNQSNSILSSSPAANGWIDYLNADRLFGLLGLSGDVGTSVPQSSDCTADINQSLEILHRDRI